MALMGSVAGDSAALQACLDNESLCTSVTRSTDSTGSMSTPHPYDNNALYMFEVTIPPVGKAVTWQFDEFEVDIHQNGTCLDEVYVFTPDASMGPFCGFDAEFANGLESLQYDYYYEELLNTQNLGDYSGSVIQGYSIQVGLATGGHVKNYGFDFSWEVSEGCSEFYELDDDGNCQLAYADTNDAIPDLESCGKSATPAGRIVGGQTGVDWPWLVRLAIDGTGTIDQCTGTILDRESILTTARCCHVAGTADKITVHVGNGSFSTSGLSFNQHPNFDPNGATIQSRSSDVCVLKVTNLETIKSDDCNNCFKAACLADETYRPGRACWTAGWGATAYQSPNSAELNAVGVNILSWEHCKAISSYWTFQFTENAEFCAGLPDSDGDGQSDGGQGACTGDQGSPLICDNDGSAVLYGIYSWATKCAEPGYPSIYADTFAMKDFIVGEMGEVMQTWVEPNWEDTSSNLIEPGLTCGNPEKSDSERSVRMMGGSAANGGWDFLVSISQAPLLDSGLVDSTAGVDCGGVIVDDEWILTSAACCESLGDLSGVTVGVSDANFKSLDDGQFYRTPRETVVNHGACMMRVDPLYWDHFDADGNKVSPKYGYACLPEEHDVTFGQKCWTAGWGETKDEGSFSNKLRSLALNVFNDDYCIDTTDYTTVEDDHFCAGLPVYDKNVSPCMRDAGGPLICAKDGAPVVYGILDGGNECPSNGNTPALFLKTGDPDVAAFIATTMATPEVTTTVLLPGPCGFFGDVPVQWQKKSAKVWFKNNDSAIVRIRNFQKQTDFDIRETPYTGFALFNKNKCGQDFLNAWTDGRIYRAEIFDSDYHYDIVGDPYYHDAGSKHSSITVQYRMHTISDNDMPFSKKGKDTKKDELYVYISGLGSVNWGNKKIDDCLNGITNGVMPMPDFDQSGDGDFASCVGEEKKVGFG